MARMMIDCDDPNSLESLQESLENSAGNCRVTYAKQHMELKKIGKSKSRKESARIIAEGTGETPCAVLMKIRRGEKEIPGHVDPKPESIENSDGKMEIKEIKHKPAKDGTMRGGAREGAGRKPKSKRSTKQENEYDHMAASMAMHYADMAIMQLMRVQKTDPRKNEAFDSVINWIAKRREENG